MVLPWVPGDGSAGVVVSDGGVSVALTEPSSSSSPSYRCDSCFSLFTSADACLQHELMSHAENLVPLQCPRCWSEFDAVEDFLSHLSSSTVCFSDSFDSIAGSSSPGSARCSFHHSGPCVVCSSCRTCYQSKENSERDEEGEPSYNCGRCRMDAEIASLVNKAAAEWGNANEAGGLSSSGDEEETRHLNEEESNKEVGSPSSSSSPSSSKSTKPLPPGVDPMGYPCGVCGKRFTRQNSLTVHRRLHTGEKPYVCSHCGRAFSDNSNYNKHRRSHVINADGSVQPQPAKSRKDSTNSAHAHSPSAASPSSSSSNDSKRALTCTTCKRSFKHPSNLQRHKKVLNH